MVGKASDPTKDPNFQKVVQTFLHTKPQPHKPLGKRKALLNAARKRKPARSARHD